MHIMLTMPRMQPAGLATYCENLALGLKERGHETTLLCGTAYDDAAQTYQAAGVFTNCIFINRGVSTARSHIHKYIAAIGEINPDALIINNSPFVSASLPFIPWHIIRIAVVHNILEDEVRSSLAQHFWWDRAVCVSPLVYNASKGLPGSVKLHVCPLGIPADEKIEKKQDNDKKPLSIAWAGRIDKLQKRSDLIPLIARELEHNKIEYTVTLFGAGPGLIPLQKAVDKMGISHKFTFRGAASREAVLDFLQKEADVFLMPSDHEGLPQALLEAMSKGAVPVVSHIPGSTDYIISNENEGFLCERGNPESFSRKIIELASDRSLIDSMSKASIQRVAENFGAHLFAKRIEGHIQTVHNDGIVRATPRPMQEVTAHIIDHTGSRACTGLGYSLKQYGKHILKKFARA